MTLLRRRPREVYRVYTEEEYLNDAGPDLATIGESSSAPVAPASQGAGARRRHRVAGVATLAGAVAIVGGLVAVNGLRTDRTAAGAGHGSLLAATHSRAVRSPVLADSDKGPSRPPAANPAVIVRKRVARRRRGSDTGRSSHPLIHRSAGSRMGVAVVVDYAPRPSAGVPSATATSVQAPPAHPGPVSGAEFGFEH